MNSTALADAPSASPRGPAVHPDPTARSTAAELTDLARRINANQYRLVHLAARYDDELDWFHQGHKSAAGWISAALGIHAATAREWIRVGHTLPHLPSIDAAFAANELSYSKVRILTRWADPHNEAELLELARERSADRLTTAIAKQLAQSGETDDERDARLHEARSVTSWTDGDGMVIIRIALPPQAGKPILAAVDALVKAIARTPVDDAPDTGDAPADAFVRQSVAGDPTQRAQDTPADASARQSVADNPTQRAQDTPADASARQSVADNPTQRAQDTPADASARQSVANDPTQRAQDTPADASVRPAHDPRHRTPTHQRLPSAAVPQHGPAPRGDGGPRSRVRGLSEHPAARAGPQPAVPPDPSHRDLGARPSV